MSNSRPTQWPCRSRGLPPLTDLSCHSAPVSYNLRTKESCIGHGRPLMKSGTLPDPVSHPETGLSAAPAASHFSRKYTIFNSCSYANFQAINSCSYASFCPINSCSYANFSWSRFPQCRYTKALTARFTGPFKLKGLNQYTQTRQKPPRVCFDFLMI